MALKSRSHILDLDSVKVSLGLFFFLSCLIKSFFPSFQDIPLFLSKTHTNLMFGLILSVAKVPWCFLEGQYMFLVFFFLS